MQPPAFWRRDGMFPKMLSPLGALLAAWTARRLAAGPRFDPGRPVICIGNLTVGGQGKTPVALAVLAHLQARGLAAFALTRGYGGRLPGPVRVDPAIHSAREVGDEALLLAAAAPTFVGKDRAAAARAAVAAGAEVLVMDDGFQNPSLRQHLALIVVDGETGFGNGRALPAGPLRESIAAGLKRAQAVVRIGVDAYGLGAHLPPQMPMLTARFKAQAGGNWRGARVFAFAGIGRPQKFFDTLVSLGVDLAGSRAFADHYRYRAADLAALRRAARAAGAQLVTTEKDFVRLPEFARAGIAFLPVHLAFDAPEALAAILAAAVPA